MSKANSLSDQTVILSTTLKTGRLICNVRKLKQGIIPPALIIPVTRAIPKPLAPAKLGGGSNCKKTELFIVKSPQSVESAKAIVIVHNKDTDSNDVLIEAVKTVNKYGKNFEKTEMVYQICAIGETKNGNATTICYAISFDYKNLVWVEIDLFKEKRVEIDDCENIEDIEEMCDYVFDYDHEELMKAIGLKEGEEESDFLTTDKELTDLVEDANEEYEEFEKEVEKVRREYKEKIKAEKAEQRKRIRMKEREERRKKKEEEKRKKEENNDE